MISGNSFMTGRGAWSGGRLCPEMSPATSLFSSWCNWQTPLGSALGSFRRVSGWLIPEPHGWRISEHQCIQESEWAQWMGNFPVHLCEPHEQFIVWDCFQERLTALSGSWLRHLHTSYLVPRLSETKARRNGGQSHSSPNQKRLLPSLLLPATSQGQAC